MKKLIVALVLTGLLFGCAKETKQTPEQVKAGLIKNIPGLPADVKVEKSPLSDIYQVVVGRKVFYASKDGKYLIFGNIINASTKENLTDKAIQELSKIDVSQIPLDLAIKKVIGTGEHKLIVFSDPECPYCKMFEQQTVPNLKNTTIYTFLFPLPIHPTAKEDSKKIWCSKDREAVWTGWMVSKKPLPTNTSCDTSGLDKIYKIGTNVVQVEGTPTLILSNGQILSGALPADQLIPMMDEASGQKVEEVTSNTSASEVVKSDASSTK